METIKQIIKKNPIKRDGLMSINDWATKIAKEYASREFERGRRKGFKEGYNEGLKVDKSDL